jgi:hypothetical protein
MYATRSRVAIVVIHISLVDDDYKYYIFIRIIISIKYVYDNFVIILRLLLHLIVLFCLHQGRIDAAKPIDLKVSPYADLKIENQLFYIYVQRSYPLIF